MAAPHERPSPRGKQGHRRHRGFALVAVPLLAVLVIAGCSGVAPTPPSLPVDSTGTVPLATLPATANGRDDDTAAVRRPHETEELRGATAVVPLAVFPAALYRPLDGDPDDAIPATVVQPAAAPIVPPSIPTRGATPPAEAWRVPVLTYHLVSATPPAWAGSDMTVTPARLEAHLHALQEGGWRTVTAGDASEALSAGDRLGPRSIIITFDDGYDDTWETVLPMLRRHGFAGTFFVLPGKFGQPYYLTADHAAALARAGMEVASHTWDHVDLSSVTFDEALRQLVRTNDELQRVTGVRPTTFAYPYGRYNQTAVRAVSAAGLQMAFTTASDCLEYGGNRLVVPRIRMNPWTTPADLLASLRRCTG